MADGRSSGFEWEIKDRTTDEEDMVDRLSDLPDHVILKIVSSIPIKEAVRTCILSNRWKYVFTWISDIDLVFPKNRAVRNTLADFVDGFLSSRQDVSVGRFRLKCVRGGYPCRINEWVHYALRHGVRELDLNIRKSEFTRLQPEVFTLQTLETLKVSLYPIFIVIVPTNCCLPNLKVLHLIALKFPDNESIGRIISCCNSLEELLVEGVTNVGKLIVVNPKLKRLTIGPTPMYYEVEINTPNLVYFKYTHYSTTRQTFINLNSVSEARIHFAVDFSSRHCNDPASTFDLMRAISHVRSLHLTDLTVREDNLLPSLIPEFPNLAYLKMCKKHYRCLSIS